MSGANTIYGAGMLELGQTFSFEQLVIDNDIIAMIKKVMEGVPVTSETLAVDAIKEVGVGRDFLGHMTTMEHFEDASSPAVFDRNMLGDWRNAGSKSAVEKAHETVEYVFANHAVKPIPEDILAAMKAIVDKADEDFKNRKEA